jgi:hypothetical protein
MSTPMPSSQRVLTGLVIIVLIGYVIRAWYY